MNAVLQAWCARNAVNPDFFMIVDTTQFAAPAEEPATAQAAPESGSVRWNIINRNNEIVHSFWNRNVQADANAVAREWFYNNDMANSSEGPFEVVPAAIPGSTLDLQRQRQAAAAPTPIAGVQDIEPDVEQYTSQPAQTQWEVYDRSTGNPVFRMYAANQAEAWRKGQEWVANYARMTPDQPIDPADYSVRQSTVPVSESQEITKLGKLDSVLEKCIEMIHRGHESDPEKYGRVAACLIDNKNNHTYAINMPGPDGTRRHAERMAIDKHLESHGRIGPNAIMITTLSPCVDHMDERYGESCTDLLSDYGIEKCYAGWQDPTQHPAVDYPFNLQITDNADIFNTCKDIAASFLPQDMTDELSETVNPDCFDPAFNDTQHFDGLTYRATVDEEYGKPVFVIRVLDDNFQQVGMAKFKPSKKGLVSLITSFRPEYQGQGIARNIYAYVRMLGNTIVPSKNQLPPGKAMWAAWKKSGDAQHLMKDVAEAYDGPQMKFLKPGELSGSYSPQQMQAMGFKQSVNGAWYIPMNMWQRLVSGGQIRENFADGRNPQDKGDSKRHGINTKASVSSLRKTAKQGGRKGQLAHWLANMKSGRAKAKRKTNEAVDQQTVAQFTDRVSAAVEMIAQKAGPNYQKIIRNIPVKITNGSATHKAMAAGDDLYIDAEEFYDAPADILMFVLAHEMAHIIFDHSWVRDPKAPPLTVQQEQQQELDADRFALDIMKKIGISKIKVWTWLRRKKDDLEAYKRRQEAAAPLGHPTFNQRSDQARRMGVELTKINTDQIDYAIQQLQHMA